MILLYNAIAGSCAEDKANAGGGAAPPIPSLLVFNLGPTVGTGSVSPGSLGAVTLIPNRASIAANTGHTIRVVPSVTLAGGASVVTATLTATFPTTGGAPGAQCTLSNHMGGAWGDAISWIDNNDPATLGAPGGALDTVMTSATVIDVAASLAAALTTPTDIYLQLHMTNGTFPPPSLIPGDTIDLEYHVTDSNGNSGTSSPITLTAA